jgi:hypothetical protein
LDQDKEFAMTHTQQSSRTQSSRDQSSSSGTEGNGPADLGNQGKEAIGQAQEQAGKFVDMAKEQATTQLTSQKARAAGSLGALAGALHEASGQVRGQDESAMADYIEAAANQVNRLAGMLREEDIDQLFATTADFARRQPALFLASTFALGFAAARFLRSSSRARGHDAGISGYRRSGDWSGQYGQGGYDYDRAANWQSRASVGMGMEGD